MTRWVMGLAGVAFIGVGLRLLSDMTFVEARSMVVWLAGGLLVHDLVFAPLCRLILLGWRRLRGTRRRSPQPSGERRPGPV